MADERRTSPFRRFFDDDPYAEGPSVAGHSGGNSVLVDTALDHGSSLGIPDERRPHPQVDEVEPVVSGRGTRSEPRQREPSPPRRGSPRVESRGRTSYEPVERTRRAVSPERDTRRPVGRRESAPSSLDDGMRRRYSTPGGAVGTRKRRYEDESDDSDRNVRRVRRRGSYDSTRDREREVKEEDPNLVHSPRRARDRSYQSNEGEEIDSYSRGGRRGDNPSPRRASKFDSRYERDHDADGSPRGNRRSGRTADGSPRGNHRSGRTADGSPRDNRRSGQSADGSPHSNRRSGRSADGSPHSNRMSGWNRDPYADTRRRSPGRVQSRDASPPRRSLGGRAGSDGQYGSGGKGVRERGSDERPLRDKWSGRRDRADGVDDRLESPSNCRRRRQDREEYERDMYERDDVGGRPRDREEYQRERNQDGDVGDRPRDRSVRDVDRVDYRSRRADDDLEDIRRGRDQRYGDGDRNRSGGDSRANDRDYRNHRDAVDRRSRDLEDGFENASERDTGARGQQNSKSVGDRDLTDRYRRRDGFTAETRTHTVGVQRGHMNYSGPEGRKEYFGDSDHESAKCEDSEGELVRTGVTARTGNSPGNRSAPAGSGNPPTRQDAVEPERVTIALDDDDEDDEVDDAELESFMPENVNGSGVLDPEVLAKFPPKYRMSAQRIELVRTHVRRETGEELRMDLRQPDTIIFVDGSFECSFQQQLQRAVNAEVTRARKRKGGRRRRKARADRNRAERRR